MKTLLTQPRPIIINEKVINVNFQTILPYNLTLVGYARKNRKKGILSEVIFWQSVNKSKFHNIDFDRQRIIGNYIVDFYVRRLGLVIEIDGDSHNDKIEYDEKRINYLKSLGLKIFMVHDIDVKLRIDLVMKHLEEFILREYT